MSLGVYNGAGAGTTKLLLHMEGDATDSSGNSNNGTSTNITYSQANGRFGQGAGFNGSSSYINIGTRSSVLNTFTWGHSIKCNNISNGHLFVATQSSTGGIQTKVSDGGNHKIQLSIWNGSTTTTLVSNKSVDDNVWHNVIFTRNGSIAKVYIDGVLDNTKTNMYTTTITPQAVDSCIGRHPSGVQYYSGLAEEIFDEDGEWSAEEVKKYYTNSRGFFATI